MSTPSTLLMVTQLCTVPYRVERLEGVSDTGEDHWGKEEGEGCGDRSTLVGNH